MASPSLPAIAGFLFSFGSIGIIFDSFLKWLEPFENDIGFNIPGTSHGKVQYQYKLGP